MKRKISLILTLVLMLSTFLNTVTFAANEQKSNNIEVLSKIAVKNSQSSGNISIEYNSGSAYNVDLYYDNGTLAKNKDVTFNINGGFYNRTVGENGLAKLNINLDSGKYLITSINTVTGAKITNNVTVISRIIENYDVTKYFRNGKSKRKRSYSNF